MPRLVESATGPVDGGADGDKPIFERRQARELAIEIRGERLLRRGIRIGGCASGEADADASNNVMENLRCAIHRSKSFS